MEKVGWKLGRGEKKDIHFQQTHMLENMTLSYSFKFWGMVES